MRGVRRHIYDKRFWLTQPIMHTRPICIHSVSGRCMTMDIPKQKCRTRMPVTSTCRYFRECKMHMLWVARDDLALSACHIMGWQGWTWLHETLSALLADIFNSCIVCTKDAFFVEWLGGHNWLLSSRNCRLERLPLCGTHGERHQVRLKIAPSWRQIWGRGWEFFSYLSTLGWPTDSNACSCASHSRQESWKATKN